MRWLGCRIPVSHIPGYGYETSPEIHVQNGWTSCVLERFGLPLYFSEEDGGAAFLDGPADYYLSDDEVRKLLSGTVFLSAETAMRLNERGFKDFTGVEVCPWTGRNASGEELYVNGGVCGAQNGLCELLPRRKGVRADSMVYHVPDGRTREPLFPGVTVFDNELGGHVVVFSGTPKANFTLTEAFSFLNESRKAQLVRLLREAGQLLVYYPEDGEFYMKAGLCPDGTLMCAAINMGFDVADELPLVVEGTVTAVEKLSPEGVREGCGFRTEDGRIVVETQAGVLEPVALFIHLKKD